jgi:hypothetical protein
MSIVVTNLELSTPDFVNGGGVSRNLFGNVFYKINALIDFEVHTFAIATDDTPITFAPTGFPDDTYIVDTNGGGFFKDFNTGDNIFIQLATQPANNGTFNNIIKIDDNTIRVATARTFQISTTAEIYLARTYNSVDFLFNLVENNDQPTFASKIDLSTQKFTANNITASAQQMTPQGFQSWVLGSAFVNRNSVSATFKNTFTITQTFYITPFFLKEDQLNTFPEYFLNANCLRYIFELNVKPNATDTTRMQTLLFDSESGSTGWLNENFNTGLTNYSISNLSYTRVSDAAPLTAVQLSDTEETEVQFNINNTTDAPFSTSPASEFVLNFINVPFEDSLYKQNGNDISFNFSFDRRKTVVDVAPVDGENAYAIKDFEVDFVSASQVTVKFKILLAATQFARIAAMETKKYLLAISVQNDANSFESDGVTLPIAYDDFFIDLGLEAAVTATQQVFLEHPFTNLVDATSVLDSFTEDEVVGYKRFRFDTSLAVPFNITGVRSGIRAANGTNTFKLSEYSLPIQNAKIVNGIEFIDALQTIPFKAPSTELVTQFKVKRDIAADASPIYFFDVYFGWINRWEYWLENGNIPADFFDISLPANGLNDNWERFDTLGYTLEHFVEWDLSVNGLTQTLTFGKDFTIADYDSNSDWDNEDIKTFDSNSNQLINGATEYILGYENTTVKCEFEYVGAGASPLTSEVTIIMRLEGYEIGGEFGSTRISSARNVGNESQWRSIDLSNKIVISKVGDTLYGEAKIDNFTLQNFSTFSITARIYDNRIFENCILKENGEEILLEDESGCILQEL